MPLLLLTVHAVPVPRLDAGNRRSRARPGPVLAEPLEGLSRLAAEMGMSKAAPEVQEGFLEVATQAEALAPPPSPPGQCPSSEPLSPEWPASSKKRPLFLRRRFRELGLLAVAAQDSFLEHGLASPGSWGLIGQLVEVEEGVSWEEPLQGPDTGRWAQLTAGRGGHTGEGTADQCTRRHSASGQAQRGHLPPWAQSFGQLAWVPPSPSPAPRWPDTEGPIRGLMAQARLWPQTGLHQTASMGQARGREWQVLSRTAGTGRSVWGPLGGPPPGLSIL